MKRARIRAAIILWTAFFAAALPRAAYACIPVDQYYRIKITQVAFDQAAALPDDVTLTTTEGGFSVNNQTDAPVLIVGDDPSSPEFTIDANSTRQVQGWELYNAFFPDDYYSGGIFYGARLQPDPVDEGVLRLMHADQRYEVPAALTSEVEFVPAVGCEKAGWLYMNPATMLLVCGALVLIVGALAAWAFQVMRRRARIRKALEE